MVELTRKEYDIIAKHRGIIEPQNMTTQELINALTRYDIRRKVKTNHKKNIKKDSKKLLKYRILQKMN